MRLDPNCSADFDILQEMALVPNSCRIPDDCKDSINSRSTALAVNNGSRLESRQSSGMRHLINDF